MSAPITAVSTLLKLALAALTTGDCALTLRTCRTALYLGGEVPWDSCGEGCSKTQNGMLWAKMVGINPTTGISGLAVGRCKSYDWTAEIGIVRCITVGEPIPTAAQVAADAQQQITDADQIFSLFTCCADANSPLRDVALTSWAPLGPQGACAGGAWTIGGRLELCC